MTENNQDAVQRAIELFQTPMGCTPYLAIRYARYMSNKYGICSEIFIIAYAAYAQKMENLKCSDDGYLVNDIEWEDFLAQEKENKNV